MKRFRFPIALLLTLVILLCFTPEARAFCGFYVAKADTSLYNQASQVVIARDGDRTVLTMANDYQGDVKDFALVVPVPVILREDQVNVGDPQIIERLDAFSAPRLVEYFDPDPCEPPVLYDRVFAPAPEASIDESGVTGDDALGVTVESQFSVGEYDIVILSARESNGLQTWLNQNGYRVPRGANRILRPYIRQGMKFFVAKVDLAELEASEYQYLRPLMMAYESPKFMLPIRLGMMNANSEQDLIVYILSPKGQAEITNYRTVEIPSNVEIPIFVKNEFGDFYQAMFQTAYNREDKKVAFLEYAWDMGSCDPCSADPLNPEELRQAGVFWLDSPISSRRSPRVFISRIHVRYSRDRFPEDLIFQETSNSQLFQGRYILRHPFTGEMQCEAGREYRRSLPERLEREARTLAQLTRWDIQEIRDKIDFPQTRSTRWWRNLWPERE